MNTPSIAVGAVLFCRRHERAARQPDAPDHRSEDRFRSPEGRRLTSLPALLFAHAARDAAQPWLFFRQSWDWRWRSWGELAAAVAALAGEVRRAATGAGLTPGQRIGFAYTPAPDAVALDLALQAAG